MGIYLIFFAVSLLFIDYPTVIAHAKSMTLSRMMPLSYEYIVRLAKGEKPFELKEVQEFYKYYRKVVDFMPYLPDGFGLVGFCQYQLGHAEGAVESYKKAIDLNPAYINFYYNLGAIFFSEGRFLAAAECFRFGVETKINDNLNFLTSSKVYFPLFMIDQTADVAILAIKQHLKEEYLACYKALVLCYYYLGQYEKVMRSSQEAIHSELGGKEFFYYFSGISAYRAGKLEMAIPLLRERLKICPKDIETMYFLALAFRDLKKEETAREYFEKIAILRQSKVEPSQDQRRFPLFLY